MARTTRQVPLYGVHFKGIYGRNRTVKFKANRDLVEAPADLTPDNFLTFVIAQADKLVADIKPKTGRLRVVVYPEGEVTTCDGEDGIDGREYKVHTYQPFGAREVLSRGYTDGEATPDIIHTAPTQDVIGR